MRLSDLHMRILEACVNDEVGLWEVIRKVIREIVCEQRGTSVYSPPGGLWTKEASDKLAELERTVDSHRLQQRTLEILRDLLETRLIDAGSPTADGGWKSWDLSPAATIERIRVEWDKLGNLPNIGDIVWFISTIEGDRTLGDGIERNTLGGV